jgi:uncharacterized protein GlcG (DUF336 family)
MNTKMSFTKTSITASLATEMIMAAVQRATELGLCIAVAVVDESGVMKAYLRMDGAPLVAVSLSRKKALTAVGFGLSTGEQWHNFIKDDPILFEGVQAIDDFTLLGGGIPIKIDGQLAGAIGISGGHYKQDAACAEAAMALLGV